MRRVWSHILPRPCGALHKLEEFNRKASVRSMAAGRQWCGLPTVNRYVVQVSCGSMWEPCGSRAGAVRPLLFEMFAAVCGLSAVLRSHDNAGKIGSSLLSTTAPTRLVQNSPGPLRIVGPTGTARKLPKYCFYSPYGALNGYVTAALLSTTQSWSWLNRSKGNLSRSERSKFATFLQYWHLLSAYSKSVQ